ncbi:Translation initiation factor IF-2 [gamma proteobacterium HdN1]|nr:Translation initiation factor IF-2 [gamma proteobacterium HdN1]
MPDVTVAQLAEVVGIPVETLLQQMKDAGLSHNKVDQAVSDVEKQQLLTHLKRAHGESGSEPQKITLKRKSVSQLKVANSQGKNKTVSVEVRKKRTYVKRSLADGDLSAQELAAQQEELLAAEDVVEAEELEAQAVVQLEQERAAEEQARKEEEERRLAVAKAQALETSAPAEAPKPSKGQKPKPAEAGPVEQKRKEKSAEEDRRSAEEQKKREENRRKAEEELKRKTMEDAKRIAEQLESRRSDSPSAEELLDSSDLIVRRAYEDSFDEEEKQSRRRRGSNRKKSSKSQPERKLVQRELVSSMSGEHGFQVPTGPVVREVGIPETITVGDLAQGMSMKGAEVVKALFKMGIMATINQVLDQETAILVVEELGHKPKTIKHDAIEDSLVASVAQEASGDLAPRAPVVTIMGHVDHGKTSLLDYLRRTRVAAGEAGGITQHIGAYHVTTPRGTVTFLDTPGHAAFTAMRARGAKATDIVVLVVAADDGVMPQTAEAIDHARAAGVPIVVAITKMDKQDVNPLRIKSELSVKGLYAEEDGGDVQFVKVSARTGLGIDDLLESILIQAELLELKAAPTGPARGVVIESSVDRGRGVMANVLVQSGELRRGDMLLAGEHYGRVRALIDESGRTIESAGPSIPVAVLGLAGAPDAGEEFLVVPDERKAREVADFRHKRVRESRLARQQASKLENLFENLAHNEMPTVNIVLKTDVRGTLEALTTALSDLSTAEVKVQIVSGGVGAINESDVNLALTSSAVLVGFNVRADASAKKICQEEGIDLRYYSVIYNIIEDVKKAMSGKLSPEMREQIVGIAEVRDVFRSSKFGAVAGCKVIEGTVYRNRPIRVLRNDIVVFEGELESLRRFKDDVNEVAHGIECGIAVKSYNDVRPGDKIEVFQVTKVARTI